MKNISTDDFCDRFKACIDGRRFARGYKTMRECYAALLDGKAGADSASWAIWVFAQQGAIDERTQRLFAVRCAREVQHLMADQRSINALDVTERYANGQATEAELTSARADAWNALPAAAWAAAWAAARAARDAAWNAAYDAMREKQLSFLRDIGNIFEEGK